MHSDREQRTTLFLGDPLQEPSEIQFLDRLRTDLAKHGREALIFANFYAGRLKQQVDFLIMTSHCTCVVELKNYTAPIFGQINGPWELRRPDGTLIESLSARNPYHQARDAKYAISDEMHSLLTDHPDLPTPLGDKKFFTTLEGVVCIFPGIPPGSQVTPGDYKTYVKGYDDFLQAILSSTTSPGWVRDHWLKLAMKLGLRQEEVSEKVHPKTRAAIQMAEAYLERFVNFHGRNLPKLVATQITKDDKPCDFESLLSLLRSNVCFQVIGPSGSGKSHLMKHLAIKSIPEGYAPIFIPAKYFSGRLSDLLDRSIAHLHPENAPQLFGSLFAAGRPPYLIIDGVNECPAKHSAALTETLQALALRRGYPIIITSQSVLDLPSELSGPLVRLHYLSNEEKQEVASVYLPEPKSQVAVMLAALKTPFEVCLAAQSALEAGQHITKYELFNAYSRKCLQCGQDSAVAFRLLVKIAQIMAERLSNSIQLSEFHRITASIVECMGTRPDAIPTALNSKLLEIQHNSCAFSHEMVQRFFEAEALLSNNSSIDACSSEMEKPRNYHLAEFVLGAQADTESARIMLRLVAFRGLLFESLDGQYGKPVQCAGLSDAFAVFSKAHEELEGIGLTFIQEKEFPEIRVEPTRGLDWTPYELALWQAIGSALARGLFVEPVFKLLRETDRKCFEFAEGRSAEEKHRRVFRHAMFAFLYVFISAKALPISHILEGLRKAVWRSGYDSVEIARMITPVLVTLESQPFGVLFLVCEVLKHVISGFVSHLARLLTVCWQTGIYYLRLDVLEVVQYAHAHVKEPLRNQIIELVKNLDSEGNLFLNTPILETLSAYQALEMPMTVNDALDEIYRFLYPTQETDKEVRELQQAERDWLADSKAKVSDNIGNKTLEQGYNYFAYVAYTKVFEDLFQGVYYDAIEQLDRENLIRFLTMAALGAPDYSIFVDTILIRLLELEDERALPAFEKWAAIPDGGTTGVDDRVESFVLAIIGLARYTDAPPLAQGPRRGDDAAWQSYREILFWLHKPSMEEEAVRRNCAPSWQRLLQLFGRAAIDPLMRIMKVSRTQRDLRLPLCGDFSEFFPFEIKKVVEFGLSVRTELTCFFGQSPWHKENHGPFILEMLEKLGDENSIPLLERLVDTPDLGQSCVKAIRVIRARVMK